MQLAHLLPVFALLGTQQALGQIITVTQTPSPSQASKLFSDLNNYLTSAEAQPEWTSVLEEIYAASAPTELPAVTVGDGLANYEQAISEINYDITGSFPNQASYPTEVVSYVKSFMAAEATIWNEDIGGSSDAKASRVPLVAMAVAAAGGVVALLAM